MPRCGGRDKNGGRRSREPDRLPKEEQEEDCGGGNFAGGGLCGPEDYIQVPPGGGTLIDPPSPCFLLAPVRISDALLDSHSFDIVLR